MNNPLQPNTELLDAVFPKVFHKETVVMGFTGKKAMQFKEAYITQFNQLKKKVATR